MSGVVTEIMEWSEAMRVEIDYVQGRPVVRAFNQAGFDCTQVDLLDLIKWVKANHPEWLGGGGESSTQSPNDGRTA